MIRPFHYHFIQIDAPDDYERYDFLFDPKKHHIESIANIPDKTEVINLRGNPIAEDIFKRIDLYYKKCPSDTFRDLLSHMLSELFYSISIFQGVMSEESLSASHLISDALRYINDNL